MQHVIHTVELARRFDGQNVVRFFDYADQRLVAMRIAADTSTARRR